MRKEVEKERRGWLVGWIFLLVCCIWRVVQCSCNSSVAFELPVLTVSISSLLWHFKLLLLLSSSSRGKTTICGEKQDGERENRGFLNRIYQMTEKIVKGANLIWHLGAAAFIGVLKPCGKRLQTAVIPMILIRNDLRSKQSNIINLCCGHYRWWWWWWLYVDEWKRGQKIDCCWITHCCADLNLKCVKILGPSFKFMISAYIYLSRSNLMILFMSDDALLIASSFVFFILSVVGFSFLQSQIRCTCGSSL